MRRAVAMAVIASSLVATACGSGDTAEPGPTIDSRPTTTTLAPIDGTVVDVNHEFWHSGFHVALTKAEAFEWQAPLTNRISYWITLWGNFENLGSEMTAFKPAMAIVDSAGTYTNRRGDPPRILPGSSALGKLTFQIPEDLDLSTAEFVVGDAGESQARVPLGALRPVTSLEPTEVAIDGQLTTELLDFTFTEVALRYDLPEHHRQLAAGQRMLTLRFDMTSRAVSAVRISADDLALLLPDGSIVEPADAELGADGATTSDRFVSFIIDEKATGDFTLRLALDPSLVADDGITEATFDFSL